MSIGMGSVSASVPKRPCNLAPRFTPHSSYPSLVQTRLPFGFCFVSVFQCDEAIVFDRVDVGLGKLGRLHCLSTTRISVGIGKIREKG